MLSRHGCTVTTYYVVSHPIGGWTPGFCRCHLHALHHDETNTSEYHPLPVEMRPSAVPSDLPPHLTLAPCPLRLTGSWDSRGLLVESPSSRAFNITRVTIRTLRSSPSCSGLVGGFARCCPKSPEVCGAAIQYCYTAVHPERILLEPWISSVAPLPPCKMRLLWIHGMPAKIDQVCDPSAHCWTFAFGHLPFGCTVLHPTLTELACNAPRPRRARRDHQRTKRRSTRTPLRSEYENLALLGLLCSSQSGQNGLTPCARPAFQAFGWVTPGALNL